MDGAERTQLLLERENARRDYLAMTQAWYDFASKGKALRRRSKVQSEYLPSDSTAVHKSSTQPKLRPPSSIAREWQEAKAAMCLDGSPLSPSVRSDSPHKVTQDLWHTSLSSTPGDVKSMDRLQGSDCYTDSRQPSYRSNQVSTFIDDPISEQEVGNDVFSLAFNEDCSEVDHFLADLGVQVRKQHSRNSYLAQLALSDYDSPPHETASGLYLGPNQYNSDRDRYS